MFVLCSRIGFTIIKAYTHTVFQQPTLNIKTNHFLVAGMPIYLHKTKLIEIIVARNHLSVRTEMES